MNNLANIKKNSNRKKNQYRNTSYTHSHGDSKNLGAAEDQNFQVLGESSVVEHSGQFKQSTQQPTESLGSTNVIEEHAAAGIGTYANSIAKTTTLTQQDSVNSQQYHHKATGWNGSPQRRASNAPHVSIRNSSCSFDLQNVITMNTKNDDQVKQDMKLYLKHKQLQQNTKYKACLEGKYQEEKQQQKIKNVLLVSFDPRTQEQEALSPLTSSKLITAYPPAYNSQHTQHDGDAKASRDQIQVQQAVSPSYVSASPFSLHPKPTDYGEEQGSERLQPDLDFILNHKDNSQERLMGVSGDQKVILENQKLKSIQPYQLAPENQLSHPSNLKTPNSLTGHRISVRRNKKHDNQSSRKTAAQKFENIPPISVNFRTARPNQVGEKQLHVEELNLQKMQSPQSPKHSSREDKTSQYSRRLIQLNEHSKSPVSTNSNLSPGRGFNNAISSVYEKQSQNNSKAFPTKHGQKQFKILSSQQLQRAMNRAQNNGGQALSRNKDSLHIDLTEPSDPAPCYVQIPLSQCNIPIADDEKKPLENKQLKNNLKIQRMQRTSGIGKIENSVQGPMFQIPVAIHQNNNPVSNHNRSHFSQNSYDDLDCASPPPVQMAPDVKNSKQRSPLTPSNDETLPLLGPDSKLYYEKALEANNQSKGFDLKQMRVPCKVNKNAPFTSNKPSITSRKSNGTAQIQFKRESTGQNYSHMEASNNSHLSINSKQDSYMKSPKTNEGSSCSPNFNKTRQTREQVNMSFSHKAQSLLKNEIENSKVTNQADPELSKELLLKSFGISAQASFESTMQIKTGAGKSQLTQVMVKQPPQIYKEKFDQAKIPVLPSWKSGLKALKHKPQTCRDMNKRNKDKLKNILEQEELRIDTTNGQKRERKKLDKKKTSMQYIADLTNKQFNQMQLLQQEFYDLFLVSDLGYQPPILEGDIEQLSPTMQLTNMTDMSLLMPDRQLSLFDQHQSAPKQPGAQKAEEKSCLQTEKCAIDSPHSPASPTSLAPLTPSINFRHQVKNTTESKKEENIKSSLRVQMPVKRPANLAMDFNDSGVQSIFKTLNSISQLKELKKLIEQQKGDSMEKNPDLQQLTSVMQHSLLQNNNQLLSQLQGMSDGAPKNAFQEVMQDDRFKKWRTKLTDINDQIQQVTHLQKYAEDPFNRSILNQDLDVSFSKPNNVEVKIEAHNHYGRIDNVSSHFGPGHIYSTVDSRYLKSPHRGTGFSNPQSRKQSTLVPSNRDQLDVNSFANQSMNPQNMDALLQKSKDFQPDKNNINHIKNVFSLDLSNMNKNVEQLNKGKLTERYVQQASEGGEHNVTTIEERLNTNFSKESSKMRCEVQAVRGKYNNGPQYNKINLMEQYQSVDSIRDQTRTTFKDSEKQRREETIAQSQDPTPDGRVDESRMSINIQVVKNKSPDTFKQTKQQKRGTPGSSGLKIISLEDSLLFHGEDKPQEDSLGEPSMISDDQLKKNMKIISDKILAREQNMHYDENYFANKNKEYEKIQKAQLNMAGMFKKNYKYAPQKATDIDMKIKQLESDKLVDEFGPFSQGKNSTASIVQHQGLQSTQRKVVEQSPNRLRSPNTNKRLSEAGNGEVVTRKQSRGKMIDQSETKLEDTNSNENQEEGENTINVPKLKSIINKHKNGKPEIGRHFRNISMESELNASENMTSCDQSYLRGMGSHKRLSSKGSPAKKISQHSNRVGKQQLQKRRQSKQKKQDDRKQLPPNKTIASVEDSSSLAQDSVLFGSGEPSKIHTQLLMIENVSLIKIRNSLESIEPSAPIENTPIQAQQVVRANQPINNDSSVFNSLVSREKLRFRFSKKYVNQNVEQGQQSQEHSPQQMKAKGSKKLKNRTNFSFLNQKLPPQLAEGQFFTARNSQSSYQTCRQKHKSFLPSLNVSSLEKCNTNNLKTPRQSMKPSPRQLKTSKFGVVKNQPKIANINTTGDSIQLSSLINSNKMKSLNTTRNQDILQKYKLLQNSSGAVQFEKPQASTLQQTNSTDSSQMPINSIAQLNQLNKMQSLQDDIANINAAANVHPASTKMIGGNQGKSKRGLTIATAGSQSPLKGSSPAKVHKYNFNQTTHVLRTIRDASNDHSGASSPRFPQGGQFHSKPGPNAETADIPTPDAWRATN